MRINCTQCDISGSDSGVDQGSSSSCVGSDAITTTGQRQRLEKLSDCIIGLWDIK
jgi:hypothetical protein